MPSSTSSSDHFQRIIPAQAWGRVGILCLAFVILSVGIWEYIARSMHHIPGTYQQQFTAMWAEERHKLDVPENNIRLLLTGSSRMLWGADLDIIEKGFGTRPLQLAIAGTSPALVLDNIVNHTDFDGIILVGVAPFLFNRLNGGAFGDSALEWYEGKSPSQHTGLAIHTFLSDYFGFLDEAFSLPELMDHYIRLPEREGAIMLKEEGWKLGNTFKDRQTDMWPPVEEIGSFDNQEMINFWLPGFRRPLPTEEKKAEMVKGAIDYYRPLIDKLRARGGDMVFIRMAGSGKYLERDLASNHKETIWQPMIEGFDVPAINSMDHPDLSTELDLPEWSHYSREGQDLFSARLVEYIEKAYLEKRGKSIYEVLDISPPEKN